VSVTLCCAFSPLTAISCQKACKSSMCAVIVVLVQAIVQHDISVTTHTSPEMCSASSLFQAIKRGLRA